MEISPWIKNRKVFLNKYYSVTSFKSEISGEAIRE